MSSRLPRLLLHLGAVFALCSPLSAQDRPPIDELGRVLILSDGRAMPLDSYARMVVGQISEARRAAGTAPLPWLARLLFTPDATLDDPVFAVEHPDSPAALGLGSGGRGHYSLRQLQPGLGRLDQLVKEAAQRGGGAGDAVEADLLRLRAAMDLYAGLGGALDFARGGDTTPLQQWARGAGNPLKVIPVGGGGDWLSPESALVAGGESARLAALLGKAMDAWTRGNWTGARQSLRAFRAAADPLAGSAAASAGLEVLYNGARPYLVSSLLALAACLLWLGAARVRWMRPASLALLAAAAVVHAAGLAARIVVTGRPPVTSLYSSFLFVAWLLLALGLLLSLRKERLWPMVAPLGAILLTALSSRFSLAGDQLGVLQAVLDTNFWLATHVVAISIGYTGALAAGLIGHAWLIRRVVRPSDQAGLEGTERALTRTILVALIFTFLGTILGGIWADQSWGRFWGWDPKENGALLIILWLAILQHARLSRMIDANGLAVGSVLLVVVVLFSWLGVNLMGVGLHAYGWTQGVGAILLVTSSFEVVFAVLGSVLARMREQPMAGLRKARVLSVTRETPDTVTVRLGFPPAHRVSGPAGRFLTLYARIDGMTRRRAYSLSSIAPSGLEAEITVKRMQDGRVSRWIADSLRTGARVTVGGPSGRFRLNGDGAAGGSEASVGAVFVAIGSGIAPLAPMAEEYLRARTAPLLLLYGSRDQEHIIFRARLEDLARRYPRLTVRHVLSEPADGWTGERGWVDGGRILREAPPRDGREYYLCGPADTIAELRQALLDGGVAGARIHEERFLPGSSDAARRASRGATVRFRRSGRDVRALPGQSVLEAGLGAGLSLPFGCAAGQCRECAARMISGRVSVEEPSPLSSAERENGVILTCVSYPTEDSEVDL